MRFADLPIGVAFRFAGSTYRWVRATKDILITEEESFDLRSLTDRQKINNLLHKGT